MSVDIRGLNKPAVTLTVDYGAFANNGNDVNCWEVVVPDGHAWRLFSVTAKLACSAAVGNRRFVLEVDNGSVKQFVNWAGAVQAASTDVVYIFAPDCPSDAAVVTIGGVSFIRSTLPSGFVVPAGSTLRLRDGANVDSVEDLVTEICVHVSDIES